MEIQRGGFVDGIPLIVDPRHSDLEVEPPAGENILIFESMHSNGIL